MLVGGSVAASGGNNVFDVPIALRAMREAIAVVVFEGAEMQL